MEKGLLWEGIAANGGGDFVVLLDLVRNGLHVLLQDQEKLVRIVLLADLQLHQPEQTHQIALEIDDLKNPTGY